MVPAASDHERQVDVVDSGSVVERAVVAGGRHVEEGVAGPQEAPDDDVRSSALVLQAPAQLRCPGHVVGARVEEVDGSVQVGSLEQCLLEQVRRRVHVHVVDQLARLRLAQTCRHETGPEKKQVF